MELRPHTLTACSCSLPAAVVISYNLLPLQEDLISRLKGSWIILYPIRVCLCELTMASFWHDSIFFQFISLWRWIGRIWTKEGGSRKRLLKEPGKGKTIFKLETGKGCLEGLSKAEISQSMFAFHFVSLAGEVTATNRCAMYTCVRKKPQRSMSAKRNWPISPSSCYSPLWVQDSFPVC